MSDYIQQEILKALKSVDRPGMEDVVEFLITRNFFKCPASTKFHGNYEGGLAEHSLNVCKNFTELLEATNLLEEVPADTIIISTILHDICKVGAYIPNNNGGFKWNREHPKGHGTLSVKRLMSLIELTPLERDLINFHMGPWNTFQMIGTDKGDYTVMDLKEAWNRNLATRFLYFADEIATVTEPVK